MMRTPSPSPPVETGPDAAVSEQAAAWVEAADTLGSTERAALAQWRAADPRHAAAHDRAAGIWADPLLAQALSELPRLARPRRLWQGAWLRGLTTAAALALLLLAAGPPLLSRWWAPVPAETGAYTTLAAQDRDYVLPDGSVLALDGASRVTTLYEIEQRLLTLEKGGAQFTVVKDARRPFIVKAGAATVRAVGTIFAVERLPGATEVAVTEGVVQVTGGGQRRELAVGGRLRVADNGAVTALPDLPPGQEAAWRNGWLDMHDQRLDQVIARLQRQTDKPIRLADPTLGTLLLTGRIRTRPAEESLRLIAGLKNLSLREEGGALVLAAAR